MRKEAGYKDYLKPQVLENWRTSKGERDHPSVSNGLDKIVVGSSSSSGKS